LLHVIYRSTGRENAKPRPPYYDKTLALASLLRSAAQCETPPSIVYLNDGEIPADRLRLMERTGDIVQLPPLPTDAYGGSPRGPLYRSYMSAIDLVDDRTWPAEDIVYFSEDDYLYLPEALPELLAAAEHLPQASYFAFEARTIESRAHHFAVGPERWIEADTSTSSFGARIGVLRQDRLIHKVAFGVGHDMQVCLAYQGIRPYRWAHIVGDALGSAPAPRRSQRERWGRVGRQFLVNVLATRASFRRRVLITPSRPLATHLELRAQQGSEDWESVAAAAADWVSEQHDAPALPS
jgi:hypothetical protein